MSGFGYHPEILGRFPAVCGGVILAKGMHNGPTPPALLAAFISEQAAVRERIGETPLSEITPLAAWRGAFRAFGVDPTKYRSAAEALLRRLTKKGDIPSINALVDLCNLVSIRYALPVAAFNASELQGRITVHFASGSELFKPHDQEQPEHPEKGEVIFSDEAGRVVARRWCWKQSQESTAREDTHIAVLTVEAQHAGGSKDIEAALGDLLDLLNRYLGGDFRSGLLGIAQPAITSG
jgi:DNA/RNA-binding domain of Phe-tRNA-synthetase-like protein